MTTITITITITTTTVTCSLLTAPYFCSLLLSCSPAHPHIFFGLHFALFAMFKIAHDGEEHLTLTKRPGRFEMYETWSGNTFKRRFVSTVVCYVDPARDPKAKAEGKVSLPSEVRIFPLWRTNQRYQMYIQEVTDVSSHIPSLLTWRSNVPLDRRSFDCVSEGITRGRNTTSPTSDSGAEYALEILQESVSFLTRPKDVEYTAPRRIIPQEELLPIVSIIRISYIKDQLTLHFQTRLANAMVSNSRRPYLGQLGY